MLIQAENPHYIRGKRLGWAQIPIFNARSQGSNIFKVLNWKSVTQEFPPSQVTHKVKRQKRQMLSSSQ